MKTTNMILSTLTVLSALAFGATSANAADDSARVRGQVSVSGPAVKAVVVGPVAIHAYSGFSGGTVYAVRAASGTDADCKAQPISGSSQVLRAETMVDLNVAAGQIACLATSTDRPFELLWKGTKDAASPVMLAKAGR